MELQYWTLSGNRDWPLIDIVTETQTSAQKDEELKNTFYYVSSWI